MDISWKICLLVLLCTSIYADEESLDFPWDDSSDISTMEEDPDASLKCEACKTIAHLFGESLADLRKNMKTSPPQLDEIASALDDVCDGDWNGYKTVEADGVQKLIETGEQKDSATPEDDSETENIWSRRLQDMCDELLSALQSEEDLYRASEISGSLEDYLCRGAETFGVCVMENWGPWPGEDDYYYDVEPDYIHDEF